MRRVIIPVLFILFFLVFFFFFKENTYGVDTCSSASCVFSQDDDYDPSTPANCYIGSCMDGSETCQGALNVNCGYAVLPDGTACRPAKKVTCPITCSKAGQDCDSQADNCQDGTEACSNYRCETLGTGGTSGVCVSGCGNSGGRCCESDNQLYCNPGLLINKIASTGCTCIAFPTSPPPPNFPCESNSFINGRCTKVPTGLGIDIDTDPTGFVKKIFSILLSIAGGVALWLIIYSGYRLLSSQGNPETIQGARETLISAIIGLIFIIFSLVIFQVIVSDILKVPNF